MDLLTQILVGIGAITSIAVIGSLVGISMAVVDDMIEEHQQARERGKRREQK